jgi:RNA methyltransferase, TrmH family
VIIRSKDNPSFKALQKLCQQSRARSQANVCLLEGEHLIEMYVAKIGPLQSLVLAERQADTKAYPADNTFSLSDALYDSLSGLVTPGGVLAVAAVPTTQPKTDPKRLLVLEDIQDPGNLGSLLRTAAAVGVDEVWCSPSCTFAWSPKTVRASQGAQFAVNIRENVDCATELAAFKGDIIATCLQDAVPYRQWQAKARWAILMGSEGQGLSEALRSLATHRLLIPMQGGVESLNVGVAAGVLLYHAVA